MCGVAAVTAAMMVVSTASQMYGQYQQYQLAGAQAAAQNAMYEQNQRSAYEAMARQYNDIGTRQAQEQQKAAEDRMEVTRQARAAMARARVAAGESGITGTSVRLGLQDISGAAARDLSTIDRNLNWSLTSLQQQKHSLQATTANRINSVAQGQQPSTGALVAGLGASAAQGYLSYQSVQPKNYGYGTTQSSAGTYRGGYFKYG